MTSAEAPRYQLAGLDPRERGFSRPVQFRTQADGWCAVLQYEALRACTDPLPTQDDALARLVHDLHAQGYRQVKTQLTHRAGEYLGNRELWVEYPDPQTADVAEGWWQRLCRWVTGSRSSQDVAP